MARKGYSDDEVFRYMTLSDEDDWDESFDDQSSGSDFEPDYSSDSLTDSDDEVEVPATARRTTPHVVGPQVAQDLPQGHQSGARADMRFHGGAGTIGTASPGPSTSASLHPGEVASTSMEVETGAVACAVTPQSQPPARKRARTTPSLPEVLANPNWQAPDTAAPVLPPFTGQSGVQVATDNLGSALDFFYLFITQDFLDLVVAQTNLKATQYINAHPDAPLAQPFRWKPVQVSELKTFLGLLLSMGLVKKNELRDYWSREPTHHTPMFSDAMSRTRFENILRFLHFNDDETCHQSDHPAYDRLHKIRPLIDHLSSRFADAYTSEQQISIDESLIRYTGRLGIKQYIPSKRARYGVKLYKLCERATGYVCYFRVYEGKDSKLEPVGCPDYLGSSGKVVWDLASPLFQKGYHLYVDNFYSSVALYQHLKVEQIRCCGTVRPSRRGFPQRLVTTKLKRGQRVALSADDLLAVKWKDKRDVYFLSTIHADTTVQIERRTGVIEKPLVVHEYNTNMGGVDFNDQRLAPYLLARKTKRWYKKIAFYLIQLAVYNSFVLYSKAGRTGSFLKFQKQIIMELLYPGGVRPQPQDATSRLHGRHYAYPIPGTPGHRPQRKRCRVCSRAGTRRDTSFYCPRCPDQPGLCVGECFERYHEQVHY